MNIDSKNISIYLLATRIPKLEKCLFASSCWITGILTLFWTDGKNLTNGIINKLLF